MSQNDWKLLKKRVMAEIPATGSKKAVDVVALVARGDRTGHVTGDARSAILHLAEEGLVCLDNSGNVRRPTST